MAIGRKEEYLLVDGYNIIFAWEELSLLAEYSLEDARLRLLDILSDYKGFSGINIITVFDAHKVKENVGTEEVYNGNITVVYTKELETADQYIERMTNLLSKDNIVRVATSDSLEQIIIMGRGAQRISARDLLYEIRSAKNKQKTQYIDKKPIKRNMLFDNLDPKMKIQLEKMRMQKGDKLDGTL